MTENLYDAIGLCYHDNDDGTTIDISAFLPGRQISTKELGTTLDEIDANLQKLGGLYKVEVYGECETKFFFKTREAMEAYAKPLIKPRAPRPEAEGGDGFEGDPTHPAYVG